MTIRALLNSCPNCVTPREELVEPEGEDGESTRLVSPQFRPSKQEHAQHCGALRWVSRGETRQFGGSAFLALQPSGSLSDQPSGLILRAHAKRGFDPRGQ